MPRRLARSTHPIMRRTTIEPARVPPETPQAMVQSTKRTSGSKKRNQGRAGMPAIATRQLIEEKSARCCRDGQGFAPPFHESFDETHDLRRFLRAPDLSRLAARWNLHSDQMAVLACVLSRAGRPHADEDARRAVGTESKSRNPLSMLATDGENAWLRTTT